MAWNYCRLSWNCRTSEAINKRGIYVYIHCVPVSVSISRDGTTQTLFVGPSSYKHRHSTLQQDCTLQSYFLAVKVPKDALHSTTQSTFISGRTKCHQIISFKNGSNFQTQPSQSKGADRKDENQALTTHHMALISKENNNPWFGMEAGDLLGDTHRERITAPLKLQAC